MPARLADTQTAKHQRDREAAAKSYSTHASDVQKTKLIAGMISGKRVNVSLKTLAKYGLKVDGNNQLIVPPEFQPKPKITVVQPPQQEITLKGVQSVVETVDPKLKEGPVSTQQVMDYFISEQYQLDKIARGEKRIKTAKNYATGANILIKLKLIEDKAQDIMPVLRDTERVIKAVRGRKDEKTGQDVSENTQTADFKNLHVMCTQVPMISQQLPKNFSYDTYGKQLSQGNESLKGKRYDALGTKSVYKWTDIVDAVYQNFGKDSEEYLYFKVYEEVPIRSELNDIPIIRGKGKVPEKGNYMIINGLSMVIYINEYKTDRFYGKKEYTLSKTLAQHVASSLKAIPRNLLFDMGDKGINVWIRTILDSVGFPFFPFGPDQTKGDRADIVSGMRHTYATFANSKKFNKDKKYPKERELAALMLHDIEQALLTYRNQSFFTKANTKAHLKAVKGI